MLLVMVWCFLKLLVVTLCVIFTRFARIFWLFFNILDRKSSFWSKSSNLFENSIINITHIILMLVNCCKSCTFTVLILLFVSLFSPQNNFCEHKRRYVIPHTTRLYQCPPPQSPLENCCKRCTFAYLVLIKCYFVRESPEDTFGEGKGSDGVEFDFIYVF